MGKAFQGTVALIGRVLLVLIFLYAAYNHATSFAGMKGFMAGKMPLPAGLITFLAAGAVAFLALGGLSVLFGAYTRIGAAMLAIFLLAVTPIFHNFWTYAAGTPEYMMQMGNFSKNVGMLGGMLVLLAMGPGPYSIDARAGRKA